MVFTPTVFTKQWLVGQPDFRETPCPEAELISRGMGVCKASSVRF
jgi:hypothetical protein